MWGFADFEVHSMLDNGKMVTHENPASSYEKAREEIKKVVALAK